MFRMFDALKGNKMSKELKTDIEKTSYALGINIGQSLRQVPKQLDVEAVVQAISDVLKGEKIALSQEDYAATMQAFQAEMQEAEKAAVDNAKAQNAAAQAAFLEENKGKEGVVTTDSGLQYKVLTEGDGPKPTAENTVRVHYTGTLLDGTVFDSSVQRGEPAEFGVGQVISGWTEALQLMNVGSKYQLYIPSELAYGDRGAGQAIAPGAMLQFEVELLDIV